MTTPLCSNMQAMVAGFVLGFRFSAVLTSLLLLLLSSDVSGADPSCETGLLSGDVCCAKSCGTCGGPGCSSLVSCWTVAKQPQGLSIPCASTRKKRNTQLVYSTGVENRNQHLSRHLLTPPPRRRDNLRSPARRRKVLLLWRHFEKWPALRRAQPTVYHIPLASSSRAAAECGDALAAERSACCRFEVLSKARANPNHKRARTNRDAARTRPSLRSSSRAWESTLTSASSRSLLTRASGECSISPGPTRPGVTPSTFSCKAFCPHTCASAGRKGGCLSSWEERNEAACVQY